MIFKTRFVSPPSDYKKVRKNWNGGPLSETCAHRPVDKRLTSTNKQLGKMARDKLLADKNLFGILIKEDDTTNALA